METHDFLEAILPELSRGERYIVSIKGSSSWRDVAFNNLAAAETFISGKISTETDIYIALASYSSGSRKGKNVTGKVCFYLDIDCGEGKPYANKAEAGQALKEFLRVTGIPTPSIIVDSGGGLHVYWCLSEILSGDEWLAAANKLQTLCEEKGLHVDSVVTIDVARVLRVPGTYNHKLAERRLCQVKYGAGTQYPITELALPFANGSVAPATVCKALAIPGADVNDDLCGGVGVNKEYSIVPALEQCAVLKGVLETHGKDCTEPMWKDVLQVLAVASDGEEYIHEVSSGHTDYTHMGTVTKFKARKRLAIGPTRCETFARHQPNYCTLCDYAGKVTSPLHIDPKALTDTTTPPANYKNKKGGIYFLVEDAADQLIWGYTLSDMTLTKDTGQGNVLHFKATMGAINVIDLPIASLSDPRGMCVSLSKQGAPVTPITFKGVSLLMHSWHDKLVASKTFTQSAEHMGWAGKNKLFVTGSKVFHVNGSYESISQNSDYKRCYMPQGDMAPWREAQDYIINQESREDLHVVMATGYGAPLMSFTEQMGGVLSIVSAQSGRGKTTAMKIAQSIWANPLIAMHSMQDTENSVNNKLGFSHSLPAYWDEVRTYDKRYDFIRSLFQFSQGREKSRLSVDSTLQKSGDWNTLITVSSNECIAEYLEDSHTGSNASRYRLFEILAKPHVTNNVAEATTIFANMKGNYGLAGEVYAKYLILNRDSIRKMMATTIKKLALTLNAEHTERFWLSITASIICGALLANRAGLANFNIKRLSAFMVTNYKAQRTHTAQVTETQMMETGAEDLLAVFLQDYWNNVLVLDIQPRQGTHRPTILRMPGPGPVIGMVSMETHVLTISETVVRRWIESRGLPPTPTLKKIRALSYVTRGRYRLMTPSLTLTPQMWGLRIHTDQGNFALPTG